ncbi:protein FAM3C-like [Syngnathus typhle]|uniref:protein FAM3C-like n=1 Tax=Syngnathus typhle TaxID=161592 RepID=UPI002A6A1FA4|nr:protein FAM3C-like [Syngnathus typhle]
MTPSSCVADSKYIRNRTDSFVADMKLRVAPFAAVIVVLVLIWAISHDYVRIRQRARDLLGMESAAQFKLKFQSKTPPPQCNLSRNCPPDHFAIHMQSGAANVVGPKICFDGKIIMSHVLNNVGPGLNIVVVNSENGAVDRCGYLNMKDGVPEDILAYLKEIKPGEIVIVASFDDATTKMTKEMREIFVGMGSALIESVRYRDNWVFAGRGGAASRSSFEKRSANDDASNLYDGWPVAVEVGGCFPRSS